MINTVIAKVFGTKNEREIKRLMPQVEAINALEPQVQKLTDAELRAKTDEFRKKIQERLSRLSPDEPGADPDRLKQLETERLAALKEVLDESQLKRLRGLGETIVRAADKEPRLEPAPRDNLRTAATAESHAQRPSSPSALSGMIVDVPSWGRFPTCPSAIFDGFSCKLIFKLMFPPVGQVGNLPHEGCKIADPENV